MATYINPSAIKADTITEDKLSSAVRLKLNRECKLSPEKEAAIDSIPGLTSTVEALEGIMEGNISEEAKAIIKQALADSNFKSSDSIDATTNGDATEITLELNTDGTLGTSENGVGTIWVEYN